jgi:hypothetical protein
VSWRSGGTAPQRQAVIAGGPMIQRLLDMAV